MHILSKDPADMHKIKGIPFFLTSVFLMLFLFGLQPLRARPLSRCPRHHRLIRNMAAMDKLKDKPYIEEYGPAGSPSHLRKTNTPACTEIKPSEKTIVQF